MLRSLAGTTLAFSLLAAQAARSAESIDPSAPVTAAQLNSLGDTLYRHSQFEEAQSAYLQVLQLESKNVRAHLGLGKIAALLSDRDGAARHFSAAYQAEPTNPDVIVAYAGVVQNREAREILFRNFLALAHGDRADDQYLDVRARLRVDEQLGTRTLASLVSPYQPYRIPLVRSRTGGLMLHARINADRGGRELKLILDTGATGIALNRRAPWARMLAIVAAFLTIIKPIAGTALAIYTLWVLMPSPSAQEYEQMAEL